MTPDLVHTIENQWLGWLDGKNTQGCLLQAP
jgi:hypothetical protein